MMIRLVRTGAHVMVLALVTAVLSVLSATTSVAAEGDPAINITLPRIHGTAAVTQILTAEPGEWDRDGLTFTYQWTRNGRPITGATRARYKVRLSDVPRQLAVVVTASQPGHADGHATSNPRRIAKLRSSTEARLVRARVRLPRITRIGRHRIRVTYLGTNQTLRSTSELVVLTVVRRPAPPEELVTGR